MPSWIRLQRLFRDDATHFIKLVKHFFRQFFDNEFISQGSDARLTVVHVLAVMAFPPILYTLYLIPVYDSSGGISPGNSPRFP